MRRPLEILLLEFRNGYYPASPIDVENSDGIFDPTSGTYAWIESVVWGILPLIVTVIESIVTTAPGVRFDWDIQSPTTGQMFHAHNYSTDPSGYIWRPTGYIFAPTLDINTLTGFQLSAIYVSPRRYY